MKNTIYLIIMMAFLSNIRAHAQKNGLEVQFLPYKDTIGPYDLLYVNLKWENKTGRKITCFLPAVKSMIQMKRIAPVSSKWYTDFGTDGLGFIREGTSDHNGWYELPVEYKQEHWYQMFPKSPEFSKDHYVFLPGSYECRLIYNPNGDPDDANFPDPCKGCLVITFNFYVKESYGDSNDAAALRILDWKKSGYRIFSPFYLGNPMNDLTCEERIQFAESFLADFPNSTFAPFIHAFLSDILARCEYRKYKPNSPEWLKVQEQVGLHYKKAKDSGHPWFNKRN